MPFLVTDSASPLAFETLPALKVTEFRGRPRRGEVYSYLRCYAHKGALHYSVTVFDGAPPATARIGFAITAQDDARRYLFAVLGKDAPCELTLYQDDAPVQTLPAPAVRQLAGQDEQGEYWGAESVLDAGLFRELFGRTPRAGMLMPGNVFLFDRTEAAFGAAFPAPADGPVPTSQGFDSFLVVPY